MIDTEQDIGGIKELIKNMMKYRGHVGIIPQVHPVTARLLMWLSGGSPVEYLNKIIADKMAEREHIISENKPDPRSESFLAKLMNLEAMKKITRVHVWDSCGSNFGAGTDTTGISLSATLWYLYKNPVKLASLRREIDEGQLTGQVSDPVTWAESQKMPYLQAVIKEGLRMHPAVGTILARTVPAGGMELSGQYFPPGVSQAFYVK
jgi:cytochrome P450